MALSQSSDLQTITDPVAIMTGMAVLGARVLDVSIGTVGTMVTASGTHGDGFHPGGIRGDKLDIGSQHCYS